MVDLWWLHHREEFGNSEHLQPGPLVDLEGAKAREEVLVGPRGNFTTRHLLSW